MSGKAGALVGPTNSYSDVYEKNVYKYKCVCWCSFLIVSHVYELFNERNETQQ